MTQEELAFIREQGMDWNDELIRIQKERDYMRSFGIEPGEILSDVLTFEAGGAGEPEVPGLIVAVPNPLHPDFEKLMEIERQKSIEHCRRFGERLACEREERFLRAFLED